MYSFREETDLNAFDSFVDENLGSYLQCSRWAKVKKAWKSYFYCGFDGDKRVLSCLILERKLPVIGSVWYIPCGFVCDYENEQLIREFSEYLKGEMKKFGAVCAIQDPLIPLRIDGESCSEGAKAHKLLTNCGYVLNKDISTYTYKHPVQTYIHLRDEENRQIPADKILKGCEKGVRYSVRIGLQRGLDSKLYFYDDVKQNPQIMEDFMSVMHDTSDRNDFVERDGDYCMHLMEIFKDCSDITIVYYDKKKDRELQEERLKKRAELEEALLSAPQKKIKGIQNEIDAIDGNTKNYNIRLEETRNYDDDARIPVAGGFTLRYSGIASCLFGGTRNIIRNNTRSSHYLNYLRICRSIELGCTIHDLGYVLVESPEIQSDGTLGKMEPAPNFVGISEFKKSFGAKYYEFIGEYVLIGNKAKYFLYDKLMPKAKKIQMAIVRKIRKK